MALFSAEEVYPTIAFKGSKELKPQLQEVAKQISVLSQSGNLYGPDINRFPHFGIVPHHGTISNIPPDHGVYNILTPAEAAALEMLIRETAALTIAFRDQAGYNHVVKDFTGNKELGSRIIKALAAKTPTDCLKVLDGLADFTREIVWNAAQCRGFYKLHDQPYGRVEDYYEKYIEALKADNWRIGNKTLTVVQEHAITENRPINILFKVKDVADAHTLITPASKPRPQGWARSIVPSQEYGVGIATEMYRKLYEYMERQGLSTKFEIKPDQYLQRAGHIIGTSSNTLSPKLLP